VVQGGVRNFSKFWPIPASFSVINNIPLLFTTQLTLVFLIVKESTVGAARNPETRYETGESVEEAMEMASPTVLLQAKVAREKKESSPEGNDTPPEHPVRKSQKFWQNVDIVDLLENTLVFLGDHLRTT